MLRCYGNKDCVILKIARDAKGRELACVKNGLLLEKAGANQQSQPPSVLSQRKMDSDLNEAILNGACTGLTHRDWLKYQMSLF